MVSAASASPATERVAFNRLLWVGPLTILAAAAANALLTAIAVAVLQPDPAFMPLNQPIPIIFTAVFVLIGLIVFAVVGRLASRPITQFRRIALVALILSFIPDILMLVTGFNPGTTAANVAVLILMHVVAWAITVGMLTRLARA